MSYVASENIRRFRAMLETPLSPERRTTIEALLATQLADLEKERHDAAPAAPDVRGSGA